MLVPDEVRKCVAFIGADAGTGRHFVGTCAFLSVGAEDWHFTYAVTAAHVIEGIRHAPGSDGKVYLRMNQKAAGARWVVTTVEQWLTHPTDTSVDVAVFPMPFTFEDWDHMSFGMVGAITQETAKTQGIGPGDEVFLTGLFVNHSGSDRNIPIVRLGAIAAMPEEPVRTQRGPIDAYLIEARSIGGLSGSPVFVNLGLVRSIEGTVKLASKSAPFYLLGLMHGHWRVETVTDLVVADGLREEIVNMGIGIVIPAYKINEVLDQPILKEPRDSALADHFAATLPIPDAPND